MGKFLNIKITDKGYEYCERKGKDSIAFVLYDRNKKLVCLRNEYKPPIDTWVLGAFGGSLDKDISLCHTVIEEVSEEAGYAVVESDVAYVGKYFVSSQMNQWCFLYAVDVTNAVRCNKKFGDDAERISDNHWTDPTPESTDWKACIIVSSIKELFDEL